MRGAELRERHGGGPGRGGLAWGRSGRGGIGALAAAALLAALGLGAAAPGVATAGDSSTAFTPDRATLDRAARLVEALEAAADAAAADRARRELHGIGAAALRPLGEAVARSEDPGAWMRLTQTFEEILRGRLQELDARVGAIEREIAEKAERGEPVGAPDDEVAAVAEALEGEVRAAGYGAARELVQPGAARDRLAALARDALLDDLIDRLRAELADAAEAPEKRTALRRRLEGLGPLAAPLLERLLADEGTPAAALAAEAASGAVERAVEALRAPEAEPRRFARHALFGLGDLAEERLEALAQAGSADERREAELLLRRIRWGISEELYERTGHLLQGFEAMTWRERRLLVFELEKQGGGAAIPALRRVLERDPSEGVKVVAAEGLARLGDRRGLEHLAGTGRTLLRQAPEVAAAIAMDQGIRYLQIRRFERAIEEFERVLEIQPQSETALYNLACTYALMGETQKALDYLERSVEAGFQDLDHIRNDPDLDGLREERRFQEIERKLEQAGRGGRR